jgi:general secretion pathway protein G
MPRWGGGCEKIFDFSPVCLHCVYMSRSLPLAKFSHLRTILSGRGWPANWRRSGGFTLIELLAVVAIIAVLAGLTLSTLGYVNKKGAEGRAKAEVAALSAAIDSFKLDHGEYPSPSNLFQELTGQGTINATKLYFEPTSGIVDTNTKQFVDPWGSAYQYTTNPTVNVGFYDLWSTAGGAAADKWIRN